jgi:hypothetical protein
LQNRAKFCRPESRPSPPRLLIPTKKQNFRIGWPGTQTKATGWQRPENRLIFRA